MDRARIRSFVVYWTDFGCARRSILAGRGSKTRFRFQTEHELLLMLSTAMTISNYTNAHLPISNHTVPYGLLAKSVLMRQCACLFNDIDNVGALIVMLAVARSSVFRVRS